MSLTLYITDDFDHNFLIYVPSDGTLGDIFEAIKPNINKPMDRFDLLNGIQSLKIGHTEKTPIADLGISAQEQTLRLRYIPSNEEQLLHAFQNTNAVSVLKWNESQNCCTSWVGIKCDDEKKNVEEIQLTGKGLTGSINWLSLPRTVDKLLISDNALIGTINLSELPQSLTAINLSCNQLDGSIDLTDILSFSHLQDVDLSCNLLTGSIDLSQLPQTLEGLSLSQNRFHGEITDLAQLPSTMTILDLSHNQFYGTIDLKKIPSNLQYLDLGDNNFHGVLNLSLIPTTMMIISFQNNQFRYIGEEPSGVYASKRRLTSTSEDISDVSFNPYFDTTLMIRIIILVIIILVLY